MIPNSFRDFIEKLRKDKKLIELNRTASKHLELAGILAALDGQVVYSEQIKENETARIAGNVFSTRELVCGYLGCEKNDLIPKLINAINYPTKPALTDAKNAPVLEVTEDEVDLSKFPILVVVHL